MMMAGTPSRLQPRAERDAALSAADDHDIGLRGVAELGLFLRAPLEPGLAALGDAVLDALGRVSGRFCSS